MRRGGSVSACLPVGRQINYILHFAFVFGEGLWVKLRRKIVLLLYTGVLNGAKRVIIVPACKSMKF
jgi:hypothetical protein